MAKCQWKPPEDTWEAKFHKGCSHDCYKDQPFCIFHVPLEAKREQPEIAEHFKESFEDLFDDLALKESAGVFSGFIFPDGTDLTGHDFTGKYVTFEGATFGDKIDLTGATFGNSVSFEQTSFGDETSFREVSFGNNIKFNNAVFGNDIDFIGALFGNYIKFISASFGGSTNFNNSTFGDSISFQKVIFSGSVEFILTSFRGSVYFYSAEFHGLSKFWNTQFGPDSDFTYAKFEEATDFSHLLGQEIAFHGLTEEEDPYHGGEKRILKGKFYRSAPPKLIFYETLFKGFARFRVTDLSKARFQQVDLRNISFFNCKISQTQFISCPWGSGPENNRYATRDRRRLLSFNRPRLLLDELLYRDQQIANGGRDRKDSSNIDREIRKLRKDHFKNIQPSDVEAVALQLKQSLEATKDPIAAGDFHFAVMEMKRMQAMESKRWGRAIMLWLYKTINGYGERYGRTALWILFLLLISSGVFAYFGYPELFKQAKYWERLEPAAFYSLQHVLPFKLGTSVVEVHKASPLMGWLTVIETIVGTTLFTFFALALRRRFKR
jgi:uncharacterized protein YjbI with pentapeptide repeats